MTTISKNRIAELLALARAKKEQESSNPPHIERSGVATEHTQIPSANKDISITTPNPTTTDRHGNAITYNAQQQRFIDLVSSGQSCVLIGAAGTGKTTCMKGAMNALIQSGRVGLLENTAHKHMVDGTPGIIVGAYTRRAVNNIRKNMSTDMQENCITIHKQLEYAPVNFTVTDPNTGEEKNKFQFLPTRDAINTLPSSVSCYVFEEASMLGLPLYEEHLQARPNEVQEIFLGDICQLPPVFGPAVLGFKLLSLPVVELTEVYRQALDSPIIRLAHRILSGKPIPATEFEEWNFPGQLQIRPWKKAVHADVATLTLAKFFERAITEKVYDPEEDIILIPFNKSCGTTELNKHIANFLARTRQLVTYEIVAGFTRHYFSVGDKCMYDKEDCIIQKIEINPEYSGASYKDPSPLLDYWGHIQLPAAGAAQPTTASTSAGDEDIDFLLAQAAATGDEDRVTAASHKITLIRLDSGTEVTISKASELNSLDLGYVLTVHKSQGSEWRKVFCCFHQSHAVMLQRELLYTAVTRAKEDLYIICEPDTFVKGIQNQRIKGNSLEEKAEYFKGKYIS